MRVCFFGMCTDNTRRMRWRARPSTQAHNGAWPFRQTLLSSASEYAKSEYAKVHFQKKKLK